MNKINTESISDEFSDKLVRVEILNRNAEFTKATLAEKRVLIAKDVIEQIKLGRFIAQPSRFFCLYDVKPVTYPVDRWIVPIHEKTRDKSVQTEILNDNISCSCCAIGSMFLSSILFTNIERLSIFAPNELFQFGNKLVGAGKFANGFDTLFTRKQLKLIEYTFENGKGFFKNTGYNKAFVNRIDSFYNQHKDTTKRLRAIMLNIISNKGTFILP